MNVPNKEVTKYPDASWNVETDVASLGGYQVILHLVLGQLPPFLVLFATTWRNISTFLTNAPRVVSRDFAIKMIIEPFLEDIMRRCKANIRAFVHDMLQIDVETFPEEIMHNDGSRSVRHLPREGREAMRTIGNHLRIFGNYARSIHTMIDRNTEQATPANEAMVLSDDLKMDMDDLRLTIEDECVEYCGAASLYRFRL